MIPEYTEYDAMHPNLVEKYLLGEPVQWSMDNIFWFNVENFYDAKDIHRLSNPEYKFRIAVKVIYKYRRVSYRGDDSIVELNRKGKPNVCYTFNDNGELLNVEKI
jgi:hypothetical protein